MGRWQQTLRLTLTGRITVFALETLVIEDVRESNRCSAVLLNAHLDHASCTGEALSNYELSRL
jgi:hypothetical protein